MKQSLNLNAWKSITAAGILAGVLLAAVPMKGQAQGNSGQGPTGNADKGKQLFNSYGCYACHGLEGQGGETGPRIGPNPAPFPAFSAYVRKPANQMPPFTEKVVSNQDLADIHAFLSSRAQPKPVAEIPLLKD